MPYNRKAIAPWSTERLQGIESATVDSNIETPQYLQPVVNTGVINKNGNWIGNVTSDRTFTIDATHEGIPNGAAVLCPQVQPDFINMSGFNDLFIAFNVATAGNYAITAVMGPDTNNFANLTPINAAATIRGAGIRTDGSASAIGAILDDSNDTLVANVWNIFLISDILKAQKVLQFKITNNTSALSNIQFAYLRVA